jgi:hypothetical protein
VAIGNLFSLSGLRAASLIQAFARADKTIALQIRHEAAAHALDSLAESPEDCVILDLYIDAEHVARLTAGVDEILGPQAPDPTRAAVRVSAEASSSVADGPDFCLPKRVPIGLAYALTDVDPALPVWLDLKPPHGLLPLVPWERLFAADLGRLVLRDSAAEAPVPSPISARRLALCIAHGSGEGAAEIGLARSQLERLFQAPQLRGRELYVFVDERHRDLVPVKNIADPQIDLVSVAFSEPPDSDSISNPWLRAMAKVLRNTGVASIAFIANGALGRNNGVLKFSPLRDPTTNPIDQDRELSVAAWQLTQFVEAVGAPSLALLHLGNLASAQGLRRLQFDFSCLRKHPILLAESVDAIDEAIGDWVRMAEGQRPELPNSLYVPRDWFRPAVVRNIGAAVETLRGWKDQLPVPSRAWPAGVNLQSALSNAGASLAGTLGLGFLEKRLRGVNPRNAQQLIAACAEQLEALGADPRQIRHYKALLDRSFREFGDSTTAYVNGALRAGRAQGEALIRDWQQQVPKEDQNRK